MPRWAMVYYGSNPTFGEHAIRLEANLFDASAGSALPERHETIWLAGYVRSEVRFDTADALKSQLAEDERIVRNMLSTSHDLNLQP